MQDGEDANRKELKSVRFRLTRLAIAALMVANSIEPALSETLIRCDRQGGVGMAFYEWVIAPPKICLRDNGSSFNCGYVNQPFEFGDGDSKVEIEVEIHPNYYKFDFRLANKPFLWSLLNRNTAIAQVLFTGDVATYECQKIQSRPKL